MPTSTIPLFFTDRMSFLPPNQQCQSTEGNWCIKSRSSCQSSELTLYPGSSIYSRTLTQVMWCLWWHGNELMCCAVLPVSISSHLVTWCIDELAQYATSSLSTAAIAMMLVYVFLSCSHLQLIILVLSPVTRCQFATLVVQAEQSLRCVCLDNNF